MKNPHNFIIFIIDENRAYRQLLLESLQITEHTRVFSFQNPDECFQFKQFKPDIIITEFRFSKACKQGLYLLDALKTKYPHSRVIFFTSYSDIESAIHAVKAGATDYILKSKYAFIKLLKRINSMLSAKKSERKNIATSRLLAASAGFLLMLMIGLVLIYTCYNQAFS
ncbi:MAG: response regulator [Bacteroidales bacterium]